MTDSGREHRIPTSSYVRCRFAFSSPVNPQLNYRLANAWTTRRAISHYVNPARNSRQLCGAEEWSSVWCVFGRENSLKKTYFRTHTCFCELRSRCRFRNRPSPWRDLRERTRNFPCSLRFELTVFTSEENSKREQWKKKVGKEKRPRMEENCQ